MPKKIFPIFAKNCMKCAAEVKFESMWEADIPTDIARDRGHISYGCKHCFPTAEAFRQELIRKDEIDEKRLIFMDAPKNVKLRDWAMISGYLTEADLKNYTDNELATIFSFM